MPGQPAAKDLATLAGNVKGAQDKLRDAMAKVAAEKAAANAAAPSATQDKT